MAFPWQIKKGDDEHHEQKKPETQLPEDVMNKINKVESLDTKVTEIGKKLEGLDTLVTFVNAQKEAAEAAAAEEAKKKNTPPEESDEDIAQQFAADPASAVKKITQPQTELLLQIQADNLRDKMLSEDSEKYPRYTGKIKQEVDALLESQPLSIRTNRAAIENAYFSVVGRHEAEITNGTLKSRFAKPDGVSQNKKEPENPEEFRKTVNIEITPDIIKAAKLTGMKPEEYVELVRASEEIEIG
jgi:hypothetical protein